MQPQSQLSSIDRRQLFLLFLGSAALSCVPAMAPREELASLLGLTGDEIAWLDDLQPEEQEALRSSLKAESAAPDPQAVELLMRTLGRRSRLYAYIGYPPASNKLTLCDGLIRE